MESRESEQPVFPGGDDPFLETVARSMRAECSLHEHICRGLSDQLADEELVALAEHVGVEVPDGEGGCLRGTARPRLIERLVQAGVFIEPPGDGAVLRWDGAESTPVDYQP
jgi:hypothetical protein